MNQPSIFIALTEGQARLEITGPLDLLQKFIGTVTKPEIFNPLPKPLDPSKSAETKR